MKRGVLLFGNAVVSIVIIGFVLQGCLRTQKEESHNIMQSTRNIVRYLKFAFKRSREYAVLKGLKCSNEQYSTL